MSTMAEMDRRIKSLEKRVQELEAVPKQELHYHSGTPAAPVYPGHPQWRDPVTCVGDLHDNTH